MRPAHILYADDDPNDVFFLNLALKKANSPCTLATVDDGEEAIAYLSGTGPFADRTRHPLPAIVLLDVKLPKKSGFEVLGWIRKQPGFKSLPVLMLTSSPRPEDIEKARLLGANDYLLKLSNPHGLIELVKSIQDRWLSQTV